MSQSDIKRARAASLLRELIPEALGNLNDETLRQVTVVDVVVKKGRYDADVYLDPSIYSESEKKDILKKLKKASPLLQNFCLEASGWFKCPKFHFKFDETIEKSKRLEELFEKIKGEH